MKKDDIYCLFNIAYRGKKNFMTPNVHTYGSINKNYVYEVSYSYFMGERLYGLTLLTTTGGKTHELNGCFSTMRAVKARIKELRKELKP